MLSALALAAIISTPSCSWDNPGANRFQGDVPSAVQHYTDIPQETRDRLQQRIAKRKFDEVVDITKTEIKGKHEYTDLRGMHFGRNQMCATVTRDKWKPDALERGMVYCSDGYCVIVPTICGNLSQITRVAPKPEPKPESKGGGGGGGAGVPPGTGDKIPGGGATTPPDTPMVPPAPLPQTNSIVPQEPDYPNRWPVWQPSPPIYIPVVVPSIPEPSTLSLLVAGLALILYKRRK
jgi:hypothetical protein